MTRCERLAMNDQRVGSLLPAAEKMAIAINHPYLDLWCGPSIFTIANNFHEPTLVRLNALFGIQYRTNPHNSSIEI